MASNILGKSNLLCELSNHNQGQGPLFNLVYKAQTESMQESKNLQGLFSLSNLSHIYGSEYTPLQVLVGMSNLTHVQHWWQQPQQQQGGHTLLDHNALKACRVMLADHLQSHECPRSTNTPSVDHYYALKPTGPQR